MDAGAGVEPAAAEVLLWLLSRCACVGMAEDGVGEGGPEPAVLGGGVAVTPYGVAGGPKGIGSRGVGTS